MSVEAEIPTLLCLSLLAPPSLSVFLAVSLFLSLDLAPLPGDVSPSTWTQVSHALLHGGLSHLVWSSLAPARLGNPDIRSAPDCGHAPSVWLVLWFSWESRELPVGGE